MIEFLKYIIDFVLHIDAHLKEIVTDYQTWTYAILFLIIFVETGLVIMPLLPGDSLLFAAGAIAAMDGNPINIGFLIILLIIAAILGDTLNYWIGYKIGTKVYEKDYKLIKRKHLDETHAFYEKHGGKTIIFARFIPIIRTFAPFVAGVGKMSYKWFMSYNVSGGILWVTSFSLLGYFFGNLEIVRKYFTLVIFAIIFLSILPPIIMMLNNWLKKRKAASTKKVNNEQ